ncbi:ribosome biogenesis factor YjgA [Pseudodesulfovibrio karagichevae]|uniref:Ribosome biogenesis factor YjgA n=1 Tax=Pseudodesulfovibrio karagichevae TaxID=3239305 RepID=A0ABV4K887_9BACT
MAKKKPTYLPSDFDEIDDRPSRSQLKRDMTSLQQLGADLAALGDKVIREAGLPPEVEKALLLLKTITKHEARRRHMQYVGRLMRTFDTAHARELVETARLGHQVKTKAFQRVEDLRDRLVDGDDELLQSLFEAHPEEGQRLRQLTLGARRENANNKPPKDTRALFRLLRDIEGEE